MPFFRISSAIFLMPPWYWYAPLSKIANSTFIFLRFAARAEAVLPNAIVLCAESSIACRYTYLLLLKTEIRGRAEVPNNFDRVLSFRLVSFLFSSLCLFISFIRYTVYCIPNTVILLLPLSCLLCGEQSPLRTECLFRGTAPAL